MESWVIIFISSLVGFLIGSIWYHPKVFGKHWLKYLKQKEKVIKEMHKESMFQKMFIMFVSLIIMSTILYYLTLYSTTISISLMAGFIIWIGFLATTMVGSVLWEGKCWNFYLINSFHYLFVIEAILIVQTLLK